VVEYDSIIQPGREGFVTQQVNLKNYHGGTVKKSITVTSNAENKPTLRLSMKVSIISIIDIKPSYVRLKPQAEGIVSGEVKLLTKKKDLKIKNIEFTPNNRGSSNAWKDQIDNTITYTVSKAAKPDSSGYYTYTVDLKNAGSSENRHGQFAFITNHPDKKEVKVRGMIQKIMDGVTQ